MKYFSLFIKGIIIGIAKVIPGVSGSMIALNMGLYEKGIEAISNFFKNKRENFIFLSIVGSGILLSIIFGSKIIDIFLLKHYIITMMFFIGLIIGSLSEISSKVNMKNKKEFLIFLLIFILMMLINFYKNDTAYVYKDSIGDYLYVILIGFIDAATMIIPGISGTAIFMIMGCYKFFLGIFVHLSFANLNIFILFLIGLFIGIILITKIINFLLKKKQEIIYPIIYGFSVSSILILLIETILKINDMTSLLLGLITLIISLFISKRLNI